MSKVKNKYSIERRYITNAIARPQVKNLGVEFIVAHETANNQADANAHYNYFNTITFSASAHTFIDDTTILEIIPLDEKAWHVRYDTPIDNRLYGDDANDVAIGTELCRTGSFNQAYDRYIWYHAYLCKTFRLNPMRHIVAHSTLDPSRRSDPESWLEPNGVSWEQFINDVKRYYDDWDTEFDNDVYIVKSGDTLWSIAEDNDMTVDELKALNNLNDHLIYPGDQLVLNPFSTGKPKANLKVDGYLGPNTIKALQRYFGTPVDGYFSKPSLVIKAMQEWLGTPVDGYISEPRSLMVEALQRRFGTPVDGFISKPSLVIKELQRRLNRGEL
nr:N-acetylmuramoyl-L-alanine amidase [Lentibacillus saliphilus]